MAEDSSLKPGKARDDFTGERGGASGKPQGKPGEDTFPGDFAKLKLSVIRPVFESIGKLMADRGHEASVSEEPGGKISIHIVPAGANKSIHPYDWFPTLSFYGAPFTKTIGLHGRNARRNSSGGSGERGNYPLPQVSRELVEKELMKFIGEIANW
jgi:hypothetical protein